MRTWHGFVHLKEEGLLGGDVDQLAVDEAEVLQRLRKEADLDLCGVDEAVPKLEPSEVRASLADALHDGGAHGLVVHPVRSDEETSDDDLRRPVVEKPEQFPELCDGERLRSGVDLSPKGLVGRDASKSRTGPTQLVEV